LETKVLGAVPDLGDGRGEEEVEEPVAAILARLCGLSSLYR
jgi:hypothetical protein